MGFLKRGNILVMGNRVHFEPLCGNCDNHMGIWNHGEL